MWNRKDIYRAVSQFFYQNILKYTSQVYSLFYNAPFVATKSRKFSIIQMLREQNHYVPRIWSQCCSSNSPIKIWIVLQNHQRLLLVCDFITSLLQWYSVLDFQVGFFPWKLDLPPTPCTFQVLFWSFLSDMLPDSHQMKVDEMLFLV